LQDWRISQVYESTISRAVVEIRERAHQAITEALEDQIPTTWYRTKAALQAEQREAWFSALRQNNLFWYERHQREPL
jgi:predicted nuclease of restriction endonuclease-like (RecB) superfamily